MRFNRAACAALAALALRWAAGDSLLVAFFVDFLALAVEEGFLDAEAFAFDFDSGVEFVSCAGEKGGSETSVTAKATTNLYNQELFEDTLIVYF